MTDVDPDDIAFIDSEDDVRAPGCLLGLSAICSVLSVIGAISPAIWFIVIGEMLRERNDVLKAILASPLALMTWALTIFIGGFGLGLGLFAIKNAKHSDRPSIAFFSRLSVIVSGGSVLIVITMLCLIFVALFV